MGGGAAGRSLRKLGLGQQREQRRSAGSAAGRLLCLPAGVTCGGGGHLNWGLEHSGKWGEGAEGGGLWDLQEAWRRGKEATAGVLLQP